MTVLLGVRDGSGTVGVARGSGEGIKASRVGTAPTVAATTGVGERAGGPAVAVGVGGDSVLGKDAGSAGCVMLFCSPALHPTTAKKKQQTRCHHGKSQLPTHIHSFHSRDPQEIEPHADDDDAAGALDRW